MFDKLPTSTLCLFHALLDVYSVHFYNFDDMKKSLFLELLERNGENGNKKTNGFSRKKS